MKCDYKVGIMKPTDEMRYFLCLGTNLGDRRKNLKNALSRLKSEGIKIRQSSSLYETEPANLPASVSKAWFYNQVVEVDIDLEPMALLYLIKKIEKKMGRRASVPNGPRIIDIDILLAADCIIQTEELVIPHPRLEERNFVLIPFREISSELRHPVLKMTIRELADKSPDRSVVKKIER